MPARAVERKYRRVELTKSRSPVCGQRGFTLLEAIVALVLISTTGLALFSWINSNIAALNRIHDTNTKSEATVNILEYMYVINPMLKPEGTASFGLYRIKWRSQPTTSLVDPASSYYQFALYNTRIEVEDKGGQAWFQLALRQVGYKKVRSAPGDI